MKKNLIILLLAISKLSISQSDTIYYDKISICIEKNKSTHDLFGYWSYNDSIISERYEGLSNPLVNKGKMNGNKFTYYDKWHKKTDVIFMSDGRVLLYKQSYWPEYYIFYPLNYNYKKIVKVTL